MDVIMGKPSNYHFWFPPYHVWLPKGSKVLFQPPLSFLWSLCAVSGREKLDVAATSQLDTLYWPTSRSLTMVVPIMPVYSTPALNYAWSNWQLQGVLRTVINSTSCTISVTWISLGDSLFFKWLTRQVVGLQRPRIRIAVVHLPVVSKLWNPFEGPGCQTALLTASNTEPTRSPRSPNMQSSIFSLANFSTVSCTRQEDASALQHPIRVILYWYFKGCTIRIHSDGTPQHTKRLLAYDIFYPYVLHVCHSFFLVYPMVIIYTGQWNINENPSCSIEKSSTNGCKLEHIDCYVKKYLIVNNPIPPL
jgi:hypothetical protein